MRMWGRRQIGILLFAHIVVANAAESSESAVIKKCRLAMSGKKVSDPNCREPALRVLRTIGVRHLFSARSLLSVLNGRMRISPSTVTETEDRPLRQSTGSGADCQNAIGCDILTDSMLLISRHSIHVLFLSQVDSAHVAI